MSLSEAIAKLEAANREQVTIICERNATIREYGFACAKLRAEVHSLRSQLVEARNANTDLINRQDRNTDAAAEPTDTADNSHAMAPVDEVKRTVTRTDEAPELHTLFGELAKLINANPAYASGYRVSFEFVKD